MLETPIQNISSELAEKLASLNINTYLDLLFHIPLRYEDLTHVTSIKESKVGTTTLVEGEIVNCEVIQRRRRQLQVTISDGYSLLTIIFFHFYPNYQKQYQIGKHIRAYGEIKPGIHGSYSMIHPKIKSIPNNEVVTTLKDKSSDLAKNLNPVYSTVNGLSQKQIIKLIDEALKHLDELTETLPNEVIQDNQLCKLSDAIKILHKPTPEEFNQQLHLKALDRLKFDELLAQQLVFLNVYQKKHHAKAVSLKPQATFTKKLFKLLPFKLTNAQTKVLGEIYADIARNVQMNRLLQGDVGSGKTIVATLAMLVAVENDYQACIVAPTEILAEQHYLKIKQLLEQIGITFVWLSGSLTKAKKQQAYSQIESGRAQVVIGTHAVFQEKVSFKKLALVVVDEQHRFGVEQRLFLQEKGSNPHQLMMSATPIPRTLAMSYYADLDVSTIDELPPGRTKIETKLINNTRRDQVISFVKQTIIGDEGSALEGIENLNKVQVYWVCPLIEESEKLDLESAINTYNELTEKLQPITVGLIHGKLKPNEKTQIMDDFKAGKIQVLVATTVIEVGVDVPAASLMVIEHSERMGLSQLHQLRGRVGRGSIQSTCVLLYQEPVSEVGKKRLKAIYENTDGFEIANQDLLIRGPGELLGSRQSGLPTLKFVDLTEDLDLLRKVKPIAKQIHKDFPKSATSIVDLWFRNQDKYLKA